MRIGICSATCFATMTPVLLVSATQAAAGSAYPTFEQTMPVESVIARPITTATSTQTALPKSNQPPTLPQPTEPSKANPLPTATTPDSSEAEIQWSTPQGKAGNSASPNRAIEVMVPLRDGNFYLGDVSARISPQGVSVPKERLLQIFAQLLRPATIETIKALPASDNNLSLTALKAAGFDIQYDEGKVEMQFNPTIEQRATGKLSLSAKRESAAEDFSHPALFATYLNMRAGASYATQSFYANEGVASTRIGFDGATRWMDIVFESAATFDTEGGFGRGGSRFIYDRPDDALRFSLGDITPGKSTFQGGSDILGVGIEKSYRKLQPGTSVHPTGNQSFRIERPSNVDVLVNGHVTQKLNLRPGDYDMDDLPLSVGANDITLVIVDDLGQQRTLNFSVFSGRSLLAPGISQWGLNAGVASHYAHQNSRDFYNLYSDLEYDFATPVVTGFYERGLTGDLTGNFHAQADLDAVMGGAGVAFQTPIGFFTLDSAASDSITNGPGYAGKVGYELINFELGDHIRRSFRLVADYRSEQFANLSDENANNDTMLDFSASYSQELFWNVSGSISGSYSVGRNNDSSYGMDLSLARSFGSSISAGVNVGFEQSNAPQTESIIADGFKASARLSYRVNERSSIDADHDARYGQSRLAYRHQEGAGIGAWNTQVELQRTPAGEMKGDDHYGVNGSLAYTANRAELAVSQHNGLTGIDTSNVEQRTSVTAGTAIAFADGRFATGRPVSNGFAIIGTHDNLPDSELTISAGQSSKRAGSDFLGPALVSDIAPFSSSRMSVDISNLPPGYDLGTGTFALSPTYKSGYALTVGSDYTISAFGTLLYADGQPVELLTGTAYEEGHPEGRTVSIFTNRVGKFSAQGLRPGRWVVDMATEPKTRFIIDVPKEQTGLTKLGTLKPTENVQ